MARVGRTLNYPSIRCDPRVSRSRIREKNKEREREREEDACRIGRTIDAKVENTEHELLREMVNPLLPTE